MLIGRLLVERGVVDCAAIELVPQAVAEGDLILPLSTDGGRLHVAVASPERADRVVAEVRFVTGRDVSPYVAVLSALRAAITGAYEAQARGAAVWRGAAAPADAGPVVAAR